MRKILIYLFSIVNLSCLFFSCRISSNLILEHDKANSIVIFRRGNIKRKALVNLPDKLKFNVSEYYGRFSLVFVLHGAGSNAAQIRETSAFDRFSDSHEFIFVYPDGINQRWENQTDNLFFCDMMEYFQNKYGVENFYLTGFSAGAVKVFELSEIFGDKIKAISPVSGLMKVQDSNSKFSPVNLLHIHSLDDLEVPSDGSTSEGFLSVKNELEFFENISKAADKKMDIREIAYEHQGHVWKSQNTDYVVDFFYNHPEKKVQLKISLDKSFGIYTVGSKIQGKIFVRNPEYVKEINILLDNNPLSTLNYGEEKFCKEKIDFEFTAERQGCFEISACTELESGEKIFSTINPKFISIKGDSELNEMVPLNVLSVKASSCESDLLKASYLIDGNLSTRWSSKWKDDEYIIFDFGDLLKFSKIILFWERAASSHYEIYISNDESEWKKIFINENCKGGTEIVNLKITEGRYVKFHFIKRKTQYGFSLWDVFFI